MNQLITLLAPRWLGGLFLVLALVLGITVLLRRRNSAQLQAAFLIVSAACGLAGLGGLFLPSYLGMILTLGGLAILFGKFLYLIVSGQWWTPLAATAAAVALVGLGAWCSIPSGEALVSAGRTLLQLEVVQPSWLWLLTLIPAIFGMSYHSLAGLGTCRRWMAMSLRASLVLFLTLALAEVRLRQANETITTLFLLDRSLSIPVEVDEGTATLPGRSPTDLRWERIKKFINEAVEKRGPEHKRDKAGLIVFGRRPRLELPPSDAPSFNFVDIASNIDSHYTDIAAAIKLALASFPEGSGKRIVLISDGNENLGNAEEQARLAKHNGVQIDVVPLGKGQRNEHEVLLQSVEAPPLTEQGSRFPIRVLIRSYNPRPVKGILELEQIVEGKREHVPPSPWGDVILRPGLNSISFPPPKDRPKGSYTYEAKFTPKFVLLEDGTQKPAPIGRIQNKQASTHVLALGQRRVLLIEATEGEHQFLVEHLRGIQDSKFRVDAITAGKLPKDKADLGVFLSNYDCVILANVPADLFDEDQMEMLRSNTHDQGCGLVMIGGPDGFGAGGWQATPVEKALPVDCDIKALKVQGKGGLVLIMHACEMADGNVWEKKIAKLAIDKLAPTDMIGVMGLGWQGMEWHVRFQHVGEKRESLKRLVDRMTPMDMPEFDTGLKMAYDKLMDPKHELTKKHVIIISDGDPVLSNQGFLAKMKADKVTVTTVGVATHGAPSDQNMNNIAVSTGGRYYNVKSPSALPQIYTKESRIVSQSFIYEKRFLPKLVISEGTTARLPENLNPLYGFVRTTPKPSPLVQMPILGPPQGDQDFPVLAQWIYGLGKAVAFTSDARSGQDRITWDREWAGSDMYLRFWEQVIDWSVRAVETGRLTMTTDYRDGKVKVIVDARDHDNKPISDLTLRGGVTPPSKLENARQFDLKFEQKNSGLYEAEFKAEEAGSYFLNAQGKRKVTRIKDGKKVEVEETDSVRSGVTIPYSPEFADMESNVALLDKLRDITGGTTIEEDADSLKEAARKGVVFRPGLPSSRSLQPIWFWLVMLTGLLLFFDIAVRRIAIEPAEIWAAGEKYWQRLRGQLVVVPATPQFLDRLKSKKTAISEELEKGRAARFEAPTGTAPLPPPPGADVGVPRKPTTTPKPATPKAGQGDTGSDDFASRLLRAKKRALEDRDKL